jgi:hypothetical protein
MPRKDELARRVDRLLAGTGTTRDLDVLFLWLRGPFYGRRAVRDIGDFVAHSDERQKGFAWEGIERFSSMMDFNIPRWRAAGRPPSNEAEAFKRSIRSAFASHSAAEVRKSIGVSRDRAKKVLTDLLEAIVSVIGDRVNMSRQPTQLEQKIIQTYSSFLRVRNSFDDIQLVTEFEECLQKNGLLNASQTLPDKIASLIALYAVEKMHLAHIVLPEGKTVVLRAGIWPDSDRPDYQYALAVSAFVPVIDEDWHATMMYPVYLTHLDPAKHLDPALLPEDLDKGAHWDAPLEIGVSGRLQML